MIGNGRWSRNKERAACTHAAPCWPINRLGPQAGSSLVGSAAELAIESLLQAPADLGGKRGKLYSRAERQGERVSSSPPPLSPWPEELPRNPVVG